MMLRPHIHVVRDADGDSNWTPFLADHRAHHEARRRQPGVVFGNPHPGRRAGLSGRRPITSPKSSSDIDLSLAWPSISRSFAATGQFDWRGERVDGSISISDFVAALSGDRSGLKARLASAPLKAGVRRHRRQPHQRDDGRHADHRQRLAAQRPALDRSGLAGGRRVRPLRAEGARQCRRRLGRADQCQCRTRRQCRRRRHDLFQQRPAVAAGDARRRRARLHALHLDLPPARQRRARLEPAAVRSQLAVDDRSRHAAVGGAGHRRPDRNSAAPRSAPICAAARWRSASAKRRSMAASPGARSGSRAPTAVAEVKAQLQFTDVDLQSCASELFGISKLSGRGNLNVSLVASGSSPFGLAQSLDGTASLTGHDGAISGFNVEQLLKRLERQAAVGRRQFPLRLDALRHAERRVQIRRRHRHRRGRPHRGAGGAHHHDRHRLGADARIRHEGHRQPDHGLERRPGFDLPFVVQGPWDDPLIFPDPESLIRRSPAAAPLLERGQGPQRARLDRAVYRRPAEAAGARRRDANAGGWGGGCGEAELRISAGGSQGGLILLRNNRPFSPHPEERRLRRVSKDEGEAGPHGSRRRKSASSP